MDNSKNEQKISKYNEAGLQIIRLNNLWVAAENHSLRARLTMWKFILDSIWRELLPDVMRHQKTKNILITNKKLKNNIAKSKNKIELYNSLDKRHQFLKYIQDLVGKGSIYDYADNEDPE